MISRVKKLQDKLAELHLDALFITNHFNIHYLSGFKGLSEHEREAYMLITQKTAYFLTDGRYDSPQFRAEMAKKNIDVHLISAEKSIFSILEELVKKDSLEHIGFEAKDMRFDEYAKCEKVVRLTPTDSVIANIRTFKDALEVAHIKKAASIADKCLKHILPSLRIGKKEREIAWYIEKYVKEMGVELAFYPIVAVDSHAAIPHFDTKRDGSAKIKNGSLILIDFGVQYKHYLSDMTRMVFVGTPEDKTVNAYNVLLNAQKKGIAALSETNDPKIIDATCREVLQQHNMPSYVHSTGHGVGLEIHENPRISHLSKDVLQKHMVFTIEPGIYIPGKFGMRIEDSVYLAEDKKPIILTTFPKKMLVI